MMSKPRFLNARAYRDVGKWWTIEIPALTSAGTDGTTVTAIGGAVSARGIAVAARDLAAVFLGVAPESVDVRVTIGISAARVAQLATKEAA
ncbi:MAG TPA: hypothetical protein VNJ54_16890 [Plantibacter sp.]|uniref:hypothetical protein n=1 Tax=unclassified Plantibacter TaxID=2624265 RepID=UPI002C088C1F|nr:hypothetical protein [Plantibacter sp.]